MTASIATVPGRSAGQSIVGRLAGARPLLRKDSGEWRHARRGWVILAVSAAFMVLAAANGAIGEHLWFGRIILFGFVLHPMSLLFAVSGSLMISRIHMPKL